MNDPVVVSLTGRIPIILMAAAVLTWPVALALLALYTRQVRRSMRRTTSASRPEPATRAEATRPTAPAARDVDLAELGAEPIDGEARSLVKALTSRPWRAAAAYAFGGAVYALVSTAATFVATGTEFLPVRFSMMFLMFAWPVVLTTGIVAGSVRRAKVLTIAGYALLVAVVASLAMPVSPDLTWWQVVALWALYNLPATLLLLTCLTRKVRAVGPLILTFLFVALAGADVSVSLAGSQDSYLRFLLQVADRISLGGYGTFLALLGIGFVIFGVIGWVALAWIGRRYRDKAISDESVTVWAIWLLFAFTHSLGLAFEHPLWVLTGPVAFALSVVATRSAFSWLEPSPAARSKAPTLLLLRSFSIGKDSERLFDALEKHWRLTGSIQLIAGVDLARRTVEPHEFLDFLSGKLARRFIDGAETLAIRMRERDTEPDRDHRYRVNDFFCHDDTWKMVLSRLVRESDAVLMDLRGFSRQNAGCVFEIQELATLVALERVVFIVDARTDETLLRETLSEAVGRVGADHALAGGARAGVFRLRGLDTSNLHRLFGALAAAARAGARGDIQPAAAGVSSVA